MKKKQKRLEEKLVKGEAIKLVQRLEMRFAESEMRESLKEKNNSFKLTESAGSANQQRKLIVTVEGIHTGMTKNLTFYPGDTLESSVPTWTAPHKKPILTNHNEYSEPLGRIVHAEYVESVIAPGKYTTRMKLEITNQEAIDKVLDGRYLTLSVGGSANKVTCSTCGKNIVAEGFCGHYRGRKYEGKAESTHWMIGEYTGDEISFVNMPADVYSQVIAAELVTAEGGENVKKGQKNKAKKPGQQAEGTDPLDLIGKLTENEGDDDADDQNEDDLDDNIDESDDGEGDGEDLNEEGSEEDGEEADESADGDDDGDGDDEGEEGDEDGEDGEDLGEKVKRLEGIIAERDQSIADLTKRAEEAEASNVTLTAELGEANTKAEGLQTQLTEAEENLASAEEERDTFQEQNLTLARYSKKLLAERVVDLRIMQKKEKAEDRDSLVESYQTSAPKVLESTITDLMKSGQRFIARVTNPGLVHNEGVEGEDGEFLEGTQKESKKPVTMADLEEQAIKSMTQRF